MTISAGAVGISVSLFTAFNKDGFGGGMYGVLNEENPSGSDITIATAGTYYGWTTATAVNLNNMTADFTGVADGLVVDDGGKGDYIVLVAVSFSGTPQKLIEGQVFINETPSHAGIRRKLGAGGDVGAAGVMDVLTLANDDKVSMRFTSTTNGDIVTIESCHFVLIKLSK